MSMNANEWPVCRTGPPEQAVRRHAWEEKATALVGLLPLACLCLRPATALSGEGAISSL